MAHIELRDVVIRKIAYTKAKKEDEDSKLMATLELDPGALANVQLLMRFAEGGSCTWKVESIVSDGTGR